MMIRSLLVFLWPSDALKRNSAIFWGTVFGAIRIAAALLMGFLIGWETSGRYADGAAAAFAAALVFAAVIEAVRSIFLHLFSRFGRWKAGITAGAFFALLEIALSVDSLSFVSPFEAIDSFVGVILPAVCLSALLTALSSYGGCVPALIYRFCVLLISVFPKQPAESTFTLLFFGVILPMFFLIALDMDWGEEKDQKDLRSEKNAAVEDDAVHGAGLKKKNYIGRILKGVIPAAAIVLLVAFFYGALPVFPAAIATGSMVPALEVGDMAVFSKDVPDDLGEGDIIAFDRDGVTVIHRIAGTDELDGETVYYTKGDANNADDEGYVVTEDIQGKMIFSVPDLGWVSLWFHS